MAMEAQTSPSPPFSTEGLGPCELSYSHSFSDLTYLKNHLWVFWSRYCNDAGTADGAVIKDKIKRYLKLLTKAAWWPCLIQFWGLVKNGDKMYLSTRDQPFAFCYSDYEETPIKKLSDYRKHCLKYLIQTVGDNDNDDDEISVDGVQLKLIGGPLARVFPSGLPEYAPRVHDYTRREYPLRDYAAHRIWGYWVFAVYQHPTQHLPSGVLEFASSKPWFFGVPQEKIVAKLQEVLLTTPCLSLAEVSSCQDGETDKIYKAMSEVCGIFELKPFHTEIWTTSGEILSSHRRKEFIRKGQGVVGKAFSSKSACFCRDVTQLSITQYPLVPLARWSEHSACFAVCLQSSCLNNCIYVLEFFLPRDTNDHAVLRTLLRKLMGTLREHLRSSFKIATGQELGQKLSVEVIKLSPADELDSFEICNTTGIESAPGLGQVQGGEGMVQLDFSSQQVDAANGSMNSIHEQQNGSVGSTPRLATAQGGEGMMQVDFSSQQVDTANAYINGVHGQQSGIVGSVPRPEHAYQELMPVQFNASNLARVDAANNSMNGIYQGQNRIVGCSPGQEPVQNIVSRAHDEPIAEINVGNPERDGASMELRNNEATNLRAQRSSYTLRSELGITRELLEQNSSRNLEDAAKVLGVSRSTLKRISREYGIHRWPPRKARKVNQAFAKQRVIQPSIENIEEHLPSDTTRAEDGSGMWVKAEYQGYTMKFKLPLSASKLNLEEEVAQRLNLSIGNFKIEYQDEENDWIWIACDKDLSTCMSTLNSLGRTTIKMKVK